jgi:UDP-2,3-diacylglucosamine hydrolase
MKTILDPILDCNSCIVAADTHIEQGTRNPYLIKLLETAEQTGSPVFFLGDLINLWFESRKLAGQYDYCFSPIKEFTEKGGNGFFIPGNRDFLAGNIFKEKTGLTILPEMADISVAGTAYRLLHGDQIFLGDRNYRIYRVLIRWKPILYTLRILPDFMLHALASILKRDPTIPEKEKEIGLDAKRFMKRIYSPDIDTYICGHVHRSMTVTHKAEAHTATIRALNSWVSEPEFFLINNNGLHVKTLSD